MVASRTLGIIKPDAVSHPIILNKIGDIIYQNSLKIKYGCRMRLNMDQAAQLYSVHRGKFFYDRLLRHMTSGPCIAMQLETNDGSDPIIKWRSILGPSKLFPNALKHPNMPIDDRTLRIKFGVSDTRNCGHGSDSPEEVDREIAVFEPFMEPIDDPFKLFQLPNELKSLSKYDNDEPDVEFLQFENGLNNVRAKSVIN